MKPRRESLRLALLTLMAAALAMLGLCGWAGEALVMERHEFREPIDTLVMAPVVRQPALFFAIDDVLAKYDRDRGGHRSAIRLVALASTNTATDAPSSMPLPALLARNEPFGLVAFRAPEDGLWDKWRQVESDLVGERALLERCRVNAASCPSNAAEFLRLIEVVRSKSGRVRLEETNRAVNAVIQYVSDLSQHGESDRWSTPLATFATHRGDCEDYAIAKYVVLQEAGFARDDLQLVLGRDRATGRDHAVLAARFAGHWLILDNRRSDLMEDSSVTAFTPLFAIDHRGVQLLAAPYVAQSLDDDAQDRPVMARRDGFAWPAR